MNVVLSIAWGSSNSLCCIVLNECSLHVDRHSGGTRVPRWKTEKFQPFFIQFLFGVYFIKTWVWVVRKSWHLGHVYSSTSVYSAQNGNLGHVHSSKSVYSVQNGIHSCILYPVCPAFMVLNQWWTQWGSNLAEVLCRLEHVVSWRNQYDTPDQLCLLK